MDKYEEPGFSGMHKIKPFCFGNIEKKRITESRAMECNRKQQRTSTFNCNRNITDSDGQENNSSQKRKCSPMEDRKILLAKWKEERELLKNKMKEKQKPLFKVGIVHHNIASPVFRDVSNEKNISRNKNVAKTLPKRGNQLPRKLKNSVESSSSNSNEKMTVFNKTTLGTGTALLKPTVLKNNVSPVNTFPFNKQKYTFSFNGVSNKKLTEPHSPSFMHCRVKRTPMNKRPLSKKPLFLIAKDREDKDDDQLAHKLTENCSVPELKSTVSSYDQISEQNVNENAKHLFLKSKDKEDKDRDTNVDQLEHTLAENCLVLEQKCTRSSCDRISEQKKNENAKSCDVSFISAEGNMLCKISKSEEIKEIINESDGNNKENEGTQILRSITQDERTAGTDDYNKGNKDIQTVNDTCEKSPAGLSEELGNNLAVVELKSNENCSPSTINTETFVISPFVTVHRGKRRSRGRRRTSSAGMPIVRDECRIKSPDSVMNECSKYHRNQLDHETGRLLSLADNWERRALEALPASIADEISGIVGQTRLLTRDKFQQFRSLIEQFENNDGPVKITDNDLAGFWEMIYLQVEHLNRKYSRLEELKNNNWQEQAAVSIKKRKTVVKTTKPTAKSRFRDFLQGKKMCDQGTENSAPTETSVPTESSLSTEISSPSKQDAPSESSRRYSSNYSPAAYVAMNTSSLGKALGHSPAIIIHNAEGSATPKSILKKKLTQSATHRKKTVLFGEDLMPCDVRSESDSHCVHSKTDDTASEASNNDPVVTTNDPVVVTDLPLVTTNNPVVATNDPVVATNDPVVTNLYTPRRSARLANKTMSSTSKAPLNTSSSCVDDSSTVTIQNAISAPEKPLKKFTLKPSSLCINPDEIIKLNAEKIQKTKNKKSVKNKSEHSDADDCNIDNCESSFEPSVKTRKSKRLSRMESDIRRTVTFEPGFDERCSAHYRKTPYKKRSRRSFSTEHE